MKKTTHYKGHRWTTNELKQLTVMWADDSIKTKEIAAKLNVTHTAILKQVNRMRNAGVKLNKRRKGNSADRHSAPWTQGDVEYLIRRRNEKATNEEIAAELGRTWNAVQAMVYKLRKENVDIKMRGNGVRALWDVEALKIVAESL